METKDDDTTLLFSDSPETVEQDGIFISRYSER